MFNTRRQSGCFVARSGLLFPTVLIYIHLPRNTFSVMASFLGLMDRSADVLADIFVKSKEAELLRREEYQHAVEIQSW